MATDDPASEDKTVASSEFVDTAPSEPLPICPHCGADPLMLAFRPFNIAAIRAVVWFCTKCRRAVPVFLLPSAPPQQPRVELAPRIIKPQ